MKFKFSLGRTPNRTLARRWKANVACKISSSI